MTPNFELSTVGRTIAEHLPAPAETFVRSVAALRPSHRRWLQSQRAYAASRVAIDDQVVEVLGGRTTVASGPMAGLRMLREGSWGHDYSARILGTYELEIHSAFEDAILSNPPVIIDIGCADGYYAVGLARRVPSAQVIGYDIDPAARRVTSTLAAANDVHIEVRSRCRPRDLMDLPDGTLILSDCEGGEDDLIVDDVVLSNPRATFIIECHDRIREGITDRLRHRFADRQIEVIENRPRSAADAPLLPATLAVQAMDERRSSESRWLIAPRSLD